MKVWPIAFCALLPGTAVSQSDADALAHIRRAIQWDSRTVCRAVRLLTPWGSSEPVRVWHAQSETGAKVTMVLAPLSQQGQTTVDDGVRWLKYYPDHNRLYIHDSQLPRRSTQDDLSRFELLRRHYRVTAEGTHKVGGRWAVRVRLTPNDPKSLYSRRFWIDKEKSVFLRVEWTHPDGRIQVVSDTICIRYPASLPAETFRVKTTGTPTEVRRHSPQRKASIAALAKAVGFTVVQPLQMPHGFLFTGADAIVSEHRRVAALRFTDGVSNVTIYQTVANGNSDSRRRNRRRGSFEMNGVLFSVWGDIPNAARDHILSALKQSTATKEAELRARAVSMFGVSERVVGALRNTGLGFDEVVAALAIGGGSPRARYRSADMFRKGKGLAEAARAFGQDADVVRRRVERFWHAK